MTVGLKQPDAPLDAPVTRRPSGLLVQILRERRAAAVGAAILAAAIVVAVAAPLLAPYGLHERVGDVFEPPSSRHWLGLDDGGVDMVTLLIWGLRISLVVGFAATLVSMLLGGAVGVLAGYFGGATDSALMRVTDYFIVIPDVPLMIVIAAIWGPSLFHIVIVIGVLLWAPTARIIRAQVKSVRERVYVQRARSIGAGHLRIIVTHVLPQVAPLLVATTVLTVAVAIFDETFLSFLGLGDPSSISLGKIIENAFERTAISSGAWWAIVPPGIEVAVLVLACSLLGQAIEDALNPRLKNAHLSARLFRMRRLAGPDRDARVARQPRDGRGAREARP
jgi:peptide/nickel transport system permease protein